MIYIGVDPGKSGAIACISPPSVNCDGITWIKNAETESDVSEFLCDWSMATFAYIERVNAMPRQGVSSTFKFGQSYGFLRGLLVAHQIPFEEVTPLKWQRAMGCQSRGDKNVTKARAQQLFPQVKVTHAIADALLIAEYCRRLRKAG